MVFLDYNVVLSVLFFVILLRKQTIVTFRFREESHLTSFLWLLHGILFFMMSVLMLIDVVSVDAVDMH